MTLLLVSLHLHAYFIQCKNRISLNLSLLFVFVGLAVISGYVSFLGDGVVWGVVTLGGEFPWGWCWMFLNNTKLIPLSYNISYCRALFRALEHLLEQPNYIPIFCSHLTRSR